jgi:hypothetical protein
MISAVIEGSASNIEKAARSGLLRFIHNGGSFDTIHGTAWEKL